MKKHTEEQIAEMASAVARHRAVKRWAKTPKKKRAGQVAPANEARRRQGAERNAARREEYERLKATGADDKAIAKAMGLSHEALRHWLWRMGMTVPWSIGRKPVVQLTREVIETMSREDCIEWLFSKDLTGDYRDKDREMEGVKPLTARQARALVLSRSNKDSA